jgi:hypothetical protein
MHIGIDQVGQVVNDDEHDVHREHHGDERSPR